MTNPARFNVNSKNGPGYGILSSGWRIIQLTALLAFLFLALARAQPPGKTLIVVAHPDDEYYFAATVYRMAVQLRGTVDELVITNGEGGVHYSTLAEPFYGETLATEESGRKELPAIRREETLKAGKVLGIRNRASSNISTSKPICWRKEIQLCQRIRSPMLSICPTRAINSIPLRSRWPR